MFRQVLKGSEGLLPNLDLLTFWIGQGSISSLPTATELGKHKGVFPKAAICDFAILLTSKVLSTNITSITTSSAMSSTPRRSFGIDESALDDNSDTPASLSGGEQRRILGRVSFNQSQHKPSFTSRWRSGQDEEGGIAAEVPGRPPIPSALEPKGESYSTPLPVLSMIVLSIVRASMSSLRWMD
jgi:hypothetical protein